MVSTKSKLAAPVSIRPATVEDWESVSALLRAARLVSLDDTAQFGEQYAVAAMPDGTIIGVAGYERYGADILLRSVAVAGAWRSAGIGGRLTADRFAHALARGCTTAYLLTDTAQDYWKQHGFVQIDRASAPAAISRSREWSAACPASAIAMRRPLTQNQAGPASTCTWERRNRRGLKKKGMGLRAYPSPYSAVISSGAGGGPAEDMPGRKSSGS